MQELNILVRRMNRTYGVNQVRPDVAWLGEELGAKLSKPFRFRLGQAGNIS